MSNIPQLGYFNIYAGDDWIDNFAFTFVFTSPTSFDGFSLDGLGYYGNSSKFSYQAGDVIHGINLFSNYPCGMLTPFNGCRPDGAAPSGSSDTLRIFPSIHGNVNSPCSVYDQCKTNFNYFENSYFYHSLFNVIFRNTTYPGFWKDLAITSNYLTGNLHHSDIWYDHNSTVTIFAKTGTYNFTITGKEATSISHDTVQTKYPDGSIGPWTTQNYNYTDISIPLTINVLPISIYLNTGYGIGLCHVYNGDANDPNNTFNHLPDQYLGNFTGFSFSSEASTQQDRDFYQRDGAVFAPVPSKYVDESSIKTQTSIVSGPALLTYDGYSSYYIIPTGNSTGKVTLKTTLYSTNPSYQVMSPSGFTTSFNILKAIQNLTNFTGIPVNIVSPIKNSSFHIGFPTSDAGLPVSVSISGVGSITGNTVYLNGQQGKIFLTASQPGNNYYQAANDVNAIINVQLLDQYIVNFPYLYDINSSSGSYYIPITLPTASSNLPVKFTVTGPARISGSGIIVSGQAGVLTVVAEQTGNYAYNPVSITGNFRVLKQSQYALSQFKTIPDQQASINPYFIPIQLPTFSSNLPGSLDVTGPASISGNFIYLNGSGGVVKITSSQTGNSCCYNAADSVSTSFNVKKLDQNIYPFLPIPDQLPSTKSFTITPPIASSLLPIDLEIGNYGVASGNTIYITGNNTISQLLITAKQTGNPVYNPAVSVVTTVNFKQSNQTISDFDQITSGISPIDAPFKISLPIASSNLPVYVSIQGVATLSGNNITLNGAEGTVWLTAQQSGNIDYLPSNIVKTYFNVKKQNQIIAISQINNMVPGSTGQQINVITSGASKNPVIFSASGAAGIVSGNILQPSGQTGYVFVTATQSGGAGYYDATPYKQTIIIAKLDQEITGLSGISDRSASYSPILIPFNLPASTGPLPVDINISGAASISGSTLVVSGQSGPVNITVSQTGDICCYNPAQQLSTSFNVKKLDQFIYPFATIPDQLPSAQFFNISPPIASSFLPTTVNVKRGPAVLNGNTLVFNGNVGNVVLEATQNGDDVYNAAPRIQTSFNIAKLNQSISNFIGLSRNILPDTQPFLIDFPFASSNLPVSVNVSSGPATLNGNIVTLNGSEGTIVLTASQTGNVDYNPAQDVNYRIIVQKYSQSIKLDSFNDVTPKTKNVKINVLSSGASNNPVRFNVSGVGNLISGNIISLNGNTGIVNITANQSGNIEYSDAPEITKSFNVRYLRQTISKFTGILTDYYVDSDPFAIQFPIASSYLPVSIFVEGPADISGNLLTLNGNSGVVQLTAIQGGDSDYGPATPISTNFNVNKHSQFISGFAPIGSIVPDSDPFEISIPSASSNLPVSLSIASGPASISGNVVTLSGQTGTVNLLATQDGNGLFYPAQVIGTSFSIQKLSQYITGFQQIPDKVFGFYDDYTNIYTPNANTSLLMHFSGADGSTQFTDSSYNNFQVVANGNAVISTANSRFGNSSLYLSGSSTNLVIPDNQAFKLLDRFNISTWFYADSLPNDISTNYASIISKYQYGGGHNPAWCILVAKNGFEFVGGIRGSAIFNTGVTLSGWHHISCSYDGSKLSMLFDGNLVGSPVPFTMYDMPGDISIGSASSQGANDHPFHGYIDELRIVKGESASFPFYPALPIPSSNLPVTLNIKSGPAFVTGQTGIWITGIGTIEVAANQSGNIRYNASNEVVSTFYSIKSGYTYDFNMTVGEFFYNQLYMTGNGALIINNLPSGLSFDSSNNSIVGAPVNIGNYSSRIARSGDPYENININFTINPPVNTGYLYAFGPGVGYGENSVPRSFSTELIKQVAAGGGFNLAVAVKYIYVAPKVVPPAPVPTPTPIVQCKTNFPYTFILTNRSIEDCISDFTFTSTITGNCGGYLDNSLGFGYMGGTAGATAMSAIINSGYNLAAYVPYIMPPGCVQQIFAGGSYGLAILQNGYITGWGDNTYNQAYGGINLTGQYPQF